MQRQVLTAGPVAAVPAALPVSVQGIVDDLAVVWGSAVPAGRPPRLLGVFAHPDDEVFCAGGTIARCVEAHAATAVVSLTRGEAGQIRDAAAATRRTLGPVRVRELAHAAEALGVDEATCLDLGDGHLEERPLAEVAATVRRFVDEFVPDVIVTFGPDGAFGHPDHITSCRATLEAVRGMAVRPRLLHAMFPMREQLMLDIIVDWLKSTAGRFSGSAAFGHALKLFADGTSMLGIAADHIDVQWFPPGSYVIEQGEPAHELYCILSGSVDIVVESDDGAMHHRDVAGPGCFVGEDGLATGRPRNAHVIARDNVTCLVLAPQRPSQFAGRGRSAADTPVSRAASVTGPDGDDAPGFVTIDVRCVLNRKVAALAAHRSQYAMDPHLFPRAVLERLLGVEHFAIAGIDEGST